MSSMNSKEPSRRDFLKAASGVGAGLLIAFYVPWLEGCEEDWIPPRVEGAMRPNAWIWVDTEGLIHVIFDEHEMGQGSSTGFLQMVCEEMEGDWKKMVWEPVPTDPSSWIRTIHTGGSTTIRLGWNPIRTAAAQAREMLRTAAAQRWGVPEEECEARENTIRHAATDRSLEYGELALAASALPVPDHPPLKGPDAYRLVGSSPDRLDLPDKVTGRTRFGMDLRLPDMLFATVARPPAFQGSVRRYDDAAARQVPGVVDVRAVEGGVAVYATDTWAAMKGKEALDVTFDPGPNADQSSESLLAHCKEVAREPGEVARREGNPDRAMERADRVVESAFDMPFLDHAPMEPLNATAHVREGGVEVWVPTQVATKGQATAARVAGVPEEKVIFHSMLSGGGFGRRLNSDDVEWAVRVAMEKDVPVQTVHTREDFMTHGFYRQATYHELRAGLDADGWPVGWTHRVVGPGPQWDLLDGARNPPYRLPDFRLDYHMEDWGIPTGAWRSVGNTHMAFVVESFMDECAHAAGADPFQYRRHLMREANPRLLACLEMAAERAEWGRPMGERQAQGIAAWACFQSYVACVAEVTVAPDGSVRVDRVVTASDHGIIVNPDAVRAQFEGGVVMALTATLKSAIHIENGAAVESNFHDYPILTMGETPPVEVHFVPSTERPGGVGEPPVPPPPPAVCNAIYAATGVRVRKLPVEKEWLRLG